jgi:succinoglycan biosynthesis protein ExoA
VTLRESGYDDKQYPLVSLVMPIKNEGPYIRKALESINRQNYPKSRIEIIIADGGSTDDTLEIVDEQKARDGRIKVTGGPGVNCPLGMNMGIELAQGTIVAKIDGHGSMNDEFIATAVDYLTANRGVSCVGGEIVAVYSSEKGKSNCLARFSKFGVGAGIYTIEKHLQEIDTVQCGVYVKDDLIRAGLFDPELQFGEDEEVNYRLVQSGGKIVFHPGMKFYYHIRPSFQSLYRQYFNYGRARVKVVKKHSSFFKLKHMIPAATVLGLAASLALLFIDRAFLPLFAAIWGGYSLFLVIASLSIAWETKFQRVDFLVTSFVCLHMGYGLGMLVGLKGLRAESTSKRFPRKP